MVQESKEYIALEKVSQKAKKKDNNMLVWLLLLFIIVIITVFLVIAVSYDKRTYKNNDESIANTKEQGIQSEQTNLTYELKNSKRMDNAKKFNIQEGGKWLRNHYCIYDELHIYAFPIEGISQDLDVDIQRILVSTEGKILGNSENLYKKDCYVYAVIGIVGNNIIKKGVILRKLNNKYAIETEYVY